jgi:hypothetical protein
MEFTLPRYVYEESTAITIPSTAPPRAQYITRMYKESTAGSVRFHPPADLMLPTRVYSRSSSCELQIRQENRFKGGPELLQGS